LPLILEQDRALHQAVMGKRKSAKRCVDLAHGNRRKLVQHRKFHPFDIDLELALQMPDKGQGQLVEATTEETDLQSVCLTKGGLPAILQSRAEHQRRGFDAEAQLLTERRQLNPPARSYEQLPPTSCSRERIASETEDWARESRFAALPKCNSMATARKQSICR